MQTSNNINDLARLDQLGPVLARLHDRTVTLTWCPSIGGFYTVDLLVESGSVVTGTGDTPGEAFAAAKDRHDARLSLTTLVGGFVVDA